MSQAAPVVAPGAMLEYFQDKKILCALCVKVDKKNAHVISEENREASLPAARVLYSQGGFMNPTALREDVVARLRREAERREAIKAEVGLPDLWELLADDPGQYSVADLAGTWFGGAVAPEQESGMMRALREDRIYFERKNEVFIPNSRVRVEQLLEAIRAEQQKEHEREVMTAWLASVWLRRHGGVSSNALPEPDCLPRYLGFFKDVAIHGPESSRFKEVQGLLQRANIGQNDAAFQVLVKAGLWDVDEDLGIHRCQLPIEFGKAVLAEADALVDEFEALEVAGQVSRGTEVREDLTALPCVTIDDEHTTEMDDALSLEALEDGRWRVGIHIADPSELVTPDSALDREALHRATSVYFPDRKIPMLPSTLGSQLCTLAAGKPRAAMTVFVELDAEGTPLASRVVESRICVAERLTYDYVDAHLETRGDLASLLRLAHALRARRLAAGAVFVPFPSVEVHVETDVDGERVIEVRREEHDIPSHVLVSEFMILANATVACFLRDAGVPALYRGQAEPTEPIELGPVFTALDGFRVRRLLRKGFTSLDPVRHSGLGLDAYLQFTSPIRRYTDLMTHRQVKHYLRHGQGLYTREDVEAMATRCSGPSEQADMLERSRKSYWIYKSLERAVWSEQRALVLQTFPDRYRVQLVNTLVEVECPGVRGVSVSPGDEIQVKIELVWPREGVLRVSPVISRK